MSTGYPGGQFGELVLFGDGAADVAVVVLSHAFDEAISGQGSQDGVDVNEHALRILMAPPDDWQDKQARVEGHVALVHRDDWAAVLARSLTGPDLAGPRVPAPRPDGREAARQLLTEVSMAWRVQSADHSAESA